MEKKRKKRIKPGHSEAFLRKQRTRQEAFLKAFKQYGRQNRACLAAKISEDAVASWRENDPEFEREYLKADSRLSRLLMDEAVRRAVEGVPKGVYYEGDLVATETEYSDTLMVRLLAAHDKRFRAGTVGDGAVVVPKVVVVNYANNDRKPNNNRPL